MSEWVYKGSIFNEDVNNYVGFVYIITNKKNNRRYIGKKLFWSTKRRQVNKKRKTFKVESDWKSYWSSSEELKADVQAIGNEHFTREIIHLCYSKGMTNYLEAKEQFINQVLENAGEWYNSWIMVKVSRSHLVNKKRKPTKLILNN